MSTIFQKRFDFIKKSIVENRKVTVVANLTLNPDEIMKENNINHDV